MSDQRKDQGCGGMISLLELREIEWAGEALMSPRLPKVPA